MLDNMDRTPVNFVGLWAMTSFGITVVVWRLSSNKHFLRGHSRLYDMPTGRGCLLVFAFAIPIALVFPLVVFLS